MSITRLRDPHKECDRYMLGALRGGMLHWGKWTAGTCSGCHCKPEVLTANDSYPYSTHPDWWWQKGRYSSACVTQLRWLLLPKEPQLDKEMKPNNSVNKWQQSARKAEMLKAPSCLCSSHFRLYVVLSSPFLQLPNVFFLLWYFHSPRDLQCHVLRNRWKCAINFEHEKLDSLWRWDATETIGCKRD